MSDHQPDTTQPEYGVEVCRYCDQVDLGQIAELYEPSQCPQCGALLYGLVGTEVIDA